jgi:hypothetical protein
MPQHAFKHQRKVDLAHVFRLLDEGLSRAEIGRRVGCDPSYISRIAHARRPAVPTNGHPQVTSNGKPDSAPPARRSASERILIGIWEQLETRVEVLEAFMAAQQSAQRTLSASAHPDALQRTAPVDWVNRGTHLAADMIERIKVYASQHRLEMREVIDLALRRFFAGEGARHG